MTIRYMLVTFLMMCLGVAAGGMGLESLLDRSTAPWVVLGLGLLACVGLIHKMRLNSGLCLILSSHLLVIVYLKAVPEIWAAGAAILLMIVDNAVFGEDWKQFVSESDPAAPGVRGMQSMITMVFLMGTVCVLGQR